MAERVKTLRLILGDQLNHQHSWFKEEQENICYVFMEMRQETDYVTHHIQKVIGFFSAMREFADWNKSKWIKLVNATKIVGYEWEGAHRALADTKALRAVWHFLQKSIN